MRLQILMNVADQIVYFGFSSIDLRNKPSVILPTQSKSRFHALHILPTTSL